MTPARAAGLRRVVCLLALLAVGALFGAQLDALFSAAEPAAATAAPASDLRARIDPLARALIDEHQVVGMVIGIVKDGNEQFLSYGETVKGSGTAPTPETVYEIGSVSKVFTGILLADLAVREGVALDTPIQRFVPAGVTVPASGDRPITLEDLATHQSGLPRLPDNLKSSNRGNPYADYTESQMYDFLERHAPGRAPGRYEYSNYGAGLLGQLLARRNGTSYEKLLVSRICEPLGLSDTRIALDSGRRKRLAPPYDAKFARAMNWDFPSLAGAGGIRSTARDMAHFIEANVGPARGGPLDSALVLARTKRHDLEDGHGIGLGWHFAQDGMTRWHNGMTGGYATWLAIAPGAGVGVVVLANTASARLDAFGEQVTRLALGLDASPVPPSAAPRLALDVEPAVLAAYVGTYALAPNFELAVTVEEGALLVQATGQSKIRVFASSPTEFFYKVVDAQITFVPDANGRVNALVLHQNGRDLAGKRVER